MNTLERGKGGQVPPPTLSPNINNLMRMVTTTLTEYKRFDENGGELPVLAAAFIGVSS